MIDFTAVVQRGAFTLDAAFTAGAGITALFGPSGSGKTTVIHLIAGVLRPTAGRIVLGERVLVDTQARIAQPSHRRRVGLVYQDAQLFPHMTVGQNLDFASWFARDGSIALPRDAVLETLGIGHLLGRRPATLSGGERQRVALARALLAAPDLLALDEPLAGLDDARKAEILPLIEQVRDTFDVPIIYVTHSTAEVRRLAARVVRLESGRVTAEGSPPEVLGAPPALRL